MLQEKVIHWGKGAPRLKSKSAVNNAFAMDRKPWVCDYCGNSFANSNDLDGKNHCCGSDKGVKPSAHRRRIFSLSLGDWLDPEVPIEWLAEMIDTIRQCDQVIWILCTKRPELFFERLFDGNDSGEFYSDSVRDYFCCEGTTNTFMCDWLDTWKDGDSPSNIILLTSVENQEQADIRIPELLKIPAHCRGLSVEPMLGPIRLRHDLTRICSRANFGKVKGSPCPECKDDQGVVRLINWVIFGGESGDKARPCNLEWIRDGVKQCQAGGVASFVKQLGADPKETVEGTRGEGVMDYCVRLKDKKGGDIEEWPEDLRIREFPKL